MLTLLTSLWWIAGLSVQSGYGIQILQYTETAAVVASASVAPELLRGLGYWFFYGGDRLGPWIEPSVDYTQRLWLIAVTYLLPTLALLAAAASRWKHRAYFAVLVFVGRVHRRRRAPVGRPAPHRAMVEGPAPERARGSRCAAPHGRYR